MIKVHSRGQKSLTFKQRLPVHRRWRLSRRLAVDQPTSSAQATRTSGCDAEASPRSKRLTVRHQSVGRSADLRTRRLPASGCSFSRNIKTQSCEIDQEPLDVLEE